LRAAGVSKGRDSSREFDPPRAIVRKQRVLKEDEVARLIEGYRNGGTMYQLAAQFGVHRVTVGVILKRNGVEIRRRGLDESQRAEVARLRGEGMSYSRIGEWLGVDASTVRRFRVRMPVVG
jgi:IS30 family transposase